MNYILGMCSQNERVFEAKNLRMGANFRLKTCGWVIVLIHETSGLVTISILLPGNGWFSCKLNKLVVIFSNFGSCFIVHSLGMGLFLLIDGPDLVCEWVPDWVQFNWNQTALVSCSRSLKFTELTLNFASFGHNLDAALDINCI